MSPDAISKIERDELRLGGKTTDGMKKKMGL